MASNASLSGEGKNWPTEVDHSLPSNPTGLPGRSFRLLATVHIQSAFSSAAKRHNKSAQGIAGITGIALGPPAPKHTIQKILSEAGTTIKSRSRFQRDFRALASALECGLNGSQIA